MDLPYNLKTDATVVSGHEQFKQTLRVLFENQIGSFLQAHDVGSRVGIHQTAGPLIEEGVRLTLEQIGGTQLKSINIQKSSSTKESYTVNLVVEYCGDIVKFTFGI